MRRHALVWATSLCILVLASISARAEERPADFSGLSLGMQTGYGFGAGDWCYCSPVALVADATGGNGGIDVGLHAAYGVRLGPLALEAETRLSYADVAFSDMCRPTLACSGKTDWLGEAGVSAGLVFWHDKKLAATLGYAVGDVRAKTTVLSGAAAGASRENTAMHDGLVYGVRGEQAMSGGWRFGLEYRYYDMSGTNLTADTAGAAVDAKIDWHAHVVGFTIAYELDK